MQVVCGSVYSGDIEEADQDSSLKMLPPLFPAARKVSERVRRLEQV
jgi:hypothetical protein